MSTEYLRKANIGSAPTFATHGMPYNLSNAHYLNNTPGAVTAVPQEVFTSGQRVGSRAVRLSATVLAGATVTAAAPPIAPLRQSVLGAAPTHVVTHPAAAYWNRPLLVRTPPPPAPASFDKQLAAIQANGGHALPRSELARLQPATAAAPVRVLPSARPAGTGTAVESPPNFAERAHTLEHSVLPSVPRQNTSYMPSASAQEAPPGAVAADPASPPRTDRPPGAVAAPVSPAGAAPESARYRPPGSQAPVVQRAPVVRPPPAPSAASPHAHAPATHDAHDSSTHAAAETHTPAAKADSR